MNEHVRTVPWADEEYAHVTTGGRRYDLVYRLDKDDNILGYRGPGNTWFDAADPAVHPPVRKRHP